MAQRERRERREFPEKEINTLYRSDSRGGVWGISSSPVDGLSKVMTSPPKSFETPESPRHPSKVLNLGSKVASTGSSAGITGVSKAMVTPSAVPVNHRQQVPVNFESWEQAQEYARRFQERRGFWDRPSLPEVDENGRLVERPEEFEGQGELPMVQTGELPMVKSGEFPMMQTGQSSR